MNEDRKSWPLIAGLTVGIVGGVIAGYFLYASKCDDEPDTKLRDAQEIIAQCQDKIKEIEMSLQTLR